MGKYDFKKVSIQQGREVVQQVNDKSVSHVIIKAHNNQEFEISWDSGNEAFCITKNKSIATTGVVENALYFTIKLK